MLSSYRVACPHEGCGWSGSLVPSTLRGGDDAEIAQAGRAWFHCPGCRRDWEVRISGDAVTVVPAAEPTGAAQAGSGRGEGRPPARRKDSVPMDAVAATHACPRCEHINSTSGVKTLQVEMRPVLTAEVSAFPEALAEVNCLRCVGCGLWICLDYRIELDDNPELDINPE